MWPSSYLERHLAKQWIAGPDIHDAIERARAFNRHDITAMINYLGEEHTGRRKIDEATEKYLALIKEIRKSRVKAVISMKPTQLGLRIRPELFEANYLKIIRYAKRNSVFVWLDMEEPDTVQDTINVYLKHVKTGNTGICIQSNLKRSAKDLHLLVRHRAKIRLVKGAYTPSQSEGYHTQASVTSNYLKLLKYLIRNDHNVLIAATHDTTMIEAAAKLAGNRKNITYAVLNGIKNIYAIELARSGKTVYAYIPFGEEWIAYSYRRIKEVGHLSLIMKSLFEKQPI
ncbi:MAG: proline dehydrogenase family protein [Candidatus Micrarchaeota archaeon]|nr:proline dehydrogenase family protein [Candidatus Micrarchaeota archaeon]